MKNLLNNFPSYTQKKSAIQNKIRKLGLNKVDDFIFHIPIRYEDKTQLTPIKDLKSGHFAQTEGKVVRVSVQKVPNHQLIAIIVDNSGELRLRWLQFHSTQQKKIVVGTRLRVYGNVRINPFGKEMIHPDISESNVTLSKSMTPIYRTTNGLSQYKLRQIITSVLNRKNYLIDSIPEKIRRYYKLIEFRSAINLLHRPPPDIVKNLIINKEHPAWIRIKFDELLAQQLSLLALRSARSKLYAKTLQSSNDRKNLVYHLSQKLPFPLTNAQKRVVQEILLDLKKSHPMQRLLQGDVGSGKTVVAMIASAQTIACNAQVALMAPTEILAEQHFRKFKMYFEPFGIKTAWLSSNQSDKLRNMTLSDISNGQIKLVIGTQALIQNNVKFDCLGLSIIDEQHRFGVEQRLALNYKNRIQKENIPHQLLMSATPIPRTLAMTFLSDLDISIIDELPSNRLEILTKLISNDRRDQVIAHITDAARNGKQIYWICPLIEGSVDLTLKAAIDIYENMLQKFPDLCIGLLHGRLPLPEKIEIMQSFQNGYINLLITTTVIEVGIDVPNASIMVIEHSERFGLAQLHQLRGRIGRAANKQSICVLLYNEPLSNIARERLKAMFETGNGFEIAKRDLEQRGPGEFLGIRQSGMTLLRFANFKTDIMLIKQAQSAAQWLKEEYPESVKIHLNRWMKEWNDYISN